MTCLFFLATLNVPAVAKEDGSIMTRKPIPKRTEDDILVSSRRRCCICYGLNRDVDLKQGQIAHLDRDANNNESDNLAFLCLVHHDEYDSRTSQRKGMTIGEVKSYRKELIDDLNAAFSQRVHFGILHTPPADPYAGNYTRLDNFNSSAEITLTPIPGESAQRPRYFVHGLAFAKLDHAYGPNIGLLEFFGEMNDVGTMSFFHRIKEGAPVVTNLRFIEPGTLEVSEINVVAEYGHGVTFEGKYKCGPLGFNP